MVDESPADKAKRHQAERLNVLRRCKTVGELFHAIFDTPMYSGPLGPDLELISLDLESGCGEDCARTLLAAQDFIKRGLPDVALSRIKDNLILLVLCQLETYYFG